MAAVHQTRRASGTPGPNFCERCGTALAAGSRFCEVCGTAVATTDGHEPVAAANVAAAATVTEPGTTRRKPLTVVVLPAVLLALLAIGGVAFWLWAPAFSGHNTVPAAEVADTTEPGGPRESPAPEQTGEVPEADAAGAAAPAASVPPPQTTAGPPPAAPEPAEATIEDWFAAQPWFVELAESMPTGVTLMLFSRPDDELPGATTVEVRENRAPDSGLDPDVSPLVGIFRVSQDRTRIFHLDVAQDEYVPLGHFLAARYQPDPDMQAPDAPVTAATLPPVEVVYRSFMDEAFRSRGGNLRVGSPHITDHRIDNTLTIGGRTLAYVFVEIANDGRTAEVLVGPQDAGADRTYKLERQREGWVITGFEEGEF